MSFEKGEKNASNNEEEGLLNHEFSYPHDPILIDKRRLLTKLFSYLPHVSTIVDSPGKLNYLFSNIEGQKGKILQYIDKNPVFLRPNIWRSLGVTEQYLHKCINQFIDLELIKKTKYSIIPPIKNLGGRRPFIYAVVDVELSGANDPRIRDARNIYYESFNKFTLDGPQIDEKESVVEYVTSHLVDLHTKLGLYGLAGTPSERMILAKVKKMDEAQRLDPATLLKIARKAANILNRMKTPRRPLS